MTKSTTGLSGSMWASKSCAAPPRDARPRSVPPTALAPAPVSAPVSHPTAASQLSRTQAFNRFEQACQRLRWKFLDLDTAWNRALAPEDFGFSASNADRNFKIDFFEFYMWIEQALVLLLLVFGISVARGQNSFGGSSAHTYHHNVLKALEEESCPVHKALGCGDVKQALWKAKELRNRWKDAAEGRETPSLKMYDLTWIVRVILGGLEVGYEIAKTTVEEEHVNGDIDIGDANEAEWDWMVEPMDWEA